LVAELVAAEPDITSPVAVAWDADGRLFVAEMSDYPLGPAGGQVRLLEDRDADGRYEARAVFADHLPYPSSVLPYKDGILVAAAPDILFLRDKDGDGRADEKQVVLTGFREGNQQLRVNGLQWGLDNWVYAANGRNDGEVRRPRDSMTNFVSLRGHDLRFRPDSDQFEPVSGRSQFGMAFDAWGNRFLSWNTIPIRHVVIEEKYLTRNPILSPSAGIHDLMPPGDSTEVFPLTSAPLVFNNESSSHFNALAGLTIYQGNALGTEYEGNAFVGETLRNLVHRRTLAGDDATFAAPRAESGKEFLASSDPWFHPVNFATGPDGCFYVVDFYRRFVEHPEYVHNSEVEKRISWRTGADHGRLWRIRKKGSSLQGDVPTLSRAPSAQLLKNFDHPNGWWRITSQRLLVERQDQAVIPVVRTMITKTNRRSQTDSELPTLSRLHALRTLEGLGGLDNTTLRDALRLGPAIVRVHAIQISEGRFHTDPSLVERVASLVADRDPRVRLQVLLSLSKTPDGSQRSLLLKVGRAFTQAPDRWEALALLGLAGTKPWPLLQLLASHNLAWTKFDTQAPFLRPLGESIAAGADAKDLKEFLDWLATRGDAHSPTSMQNAVILLLAGAADGLARTDRTLRDLIEHPPAALTPATSRLRRFLQEVPLAIPGSRSLPPTDVLSSRYVDASSVVDRQQAEDRSMMKSYHTRLELAVIRLLGETDASVAGVPLLAQLSRPKDPAFQRAVVQALIRLDNPKLYSRVFDTWVSCPISFRREWITMAPRTPMLGAALLEALERGTISIAEIDALTRQNLLKSTDLNLRERATRLLRATVSADRDQIVRSFEPALQLAGDSLRGAQIFGRSCLICHRIQGKGKRVGPDLSGIASRPKNSLLIDVFDPSRQMSPDFLNYTATLTNGETVAGFIVGDSTFSVSLRGADGVDTVLVRSQIKNLQPEARSLMPDGLEQDLSQQDVADLLEFLSQPDAALLP
jgi:putative membrane-bound dehydrogenase-like protein